ncbi:MAG: hypothetical protein IJ242_12905 [Clostridia bacterium]|nr:hypothetical protein [Clostridia bacterium]
MASYSARDVILMPEWCDNPFRYEMEMIRHFVPVCQIMTFAIDMVLKE